MTQAQDLQTLNRLSDEDFGHLMMDCCGSAEWAVRMSENRPFAHRSDLLVTAKILWKGLGPKDWKEAFSHHPRIGERSQDQTAMREQSLMSTATEGQRKDIARLNDEYLKKFGFIFITFATGKSPKDILFELERRLSNDFQREISIAAEEQAKITELRLKALCKE